MGSPVGAGGGREHEGRVVLSAHPVFVARKVAGVHGFLQTIPDEIVQRRARVEHIDEGRVVAEQTERAAARVLACTLITFEHPLAKRLYLLRHVVERAGGRAEHRHDRAAAHARRVADGQESALDSGSISSAWSRNYLVRFLAWASVMLGVMPQLDGRLLLAHVCENDGVWRDYSRKCLPNHRNFHNWLQRFHAANTFEKED